jgi:hypothetical protein
VITLQELMPLLIVTNFATFGIQRTGGGGAAAAPSTGGGSGGGGASQQQTGMRSRCRRLGRCAPAVHTLRFTVSYTGGRSRSTCTEGRSGGSKHQVWRGPDLTAPQHSSTLLIGWRVVIDRCEISSALLSASCSKVPDGGVQGLN